MKKSNLFRFFENFFSNKYTKTILKSEIQGGGTDAKIKHSDSLIRFNARALNERLQSVAWDSHLLILVCDSEEDFECQAAAKFLEILNRSNPNSSLDFGFVDSEKNKLDMRLMDSPVSPRFFGFQKKKKFMAQLFAQEFSFDGLVEWVNQTFFDQEELKIKFDEETRKEVTLEIANLKGERDRIQELLENEQSNTEDL